MSINLDIVRGVLQLIRDNPEEHDQNFWLSTKENDEVELSLEDFQAGSLCGTTACIAGWVALAGGWTFKLQKEKDQHGTYYERFFVKEDEEPVEIDDTPDLALSILGDPDNETEFRDLFYLLNDRKAIAELMFFYENERMPEVSADRLTSSVLIEDLPMEDFVDEWYELFEQEFTPTPKEVSAQ